MATILIVDDRSSNRQFLTTLLGYGGHRMLEAVNGAEALEQVRAKHPDLVITDILMPIMDGFEFVQQLRADPALLDTKVIFHTATYSEPEAQKLALSCGVRTVLPKPCEPQQVFDAVERELGAQRPIRADAAAPKKAGGSAGDLPEVDHTLSLRFKDLQAAQRKVERFLERSGRGERDRRLWQEFSGDIEGLQRLASRLSALVEVAMEMMQERDPTRLVKLFFGAACEMVESEYTALCILGGDAQAPHHVLGRNVDPKLYRSGDAARSGLPGSLLDGRRALRGHGAAMASSAEGLPAGHPAVRSFLGVALATRDQVYGWLYFADRRGAKAFSEEDERMAAILAAKLALLYENTHLYDVIQRHAANLQLESAERARAQNALREREAGLRRAQSLARLSHVITTTDGAFESWSESLPALVGIAEAAMPASTRDWLQLIHPDDRAKFRATAIEAARTGARTEVDYRLKLGADAWTHIRQVLEPLAAQPSPRGGVRWFNTLQDVTDQKLAAEALHKAESRFRLIFENSVEGIFQTSTEGRVLLANDAAARILGYDSPEDVIASLTDVGRQVYVRSEDRVRLYELVQAQGFVRGFEVQYRRKDGGVIWVSVSARVMRDQGGGASLLGMIQDISERKAQRDRIDRLNRVYAVLSRINTLIVRVRTREELFQEACRIAVDAGQFRLAWIGMVDAEGMHVSPVAWSGDGDGYIQAMPVMLAKPGAAGRGLSATAIEERKAVIVDDMTQDRRVLLSKEAQARGFRSLAMLPLVVSGKAVGVLALYAGEVGFFDAEEIKLLMELTGDIAFAMQHLEAVGKVEYLAFHDPLTGLPNRAVLTDRLGQVMSAARRDRQFAAVIFFDVERFRRINDTLGRQAGDEFLVGVAERFRVAIRAQDTVARVGADVFAVAVGGFPHVTDATHLVSGLLSRAFASPITVGGQEFRAALKAGIAIFPNDGDTADILCRNAEGALKRAKDSGERFVFYTPEINARVAESLALENKLRRALEAKEFVLHYQPKVDARTRALVGLEALIRWNDPQLGLVPPGKFIPLMEETGIILQAGGWALRRAVADVQAWRAKGLVAPRVAVNVSQIQLRQTDFVQTVLQALEGFGDAEPLLDLEITESMVMQNFDATVRALQTLRGVGVETSLDDFGTGYSSLAFVARLPVAALKIDRSFVIEMVASKYARTIVETVISLAHSLGLKVIAEGVDAEEQLQLLASLGCDQIQGYLISKPVPPEQIEAMLAKA